MELINPAFVLIAIGFVVVLGWCWWRRRHRRTRPLDTSALDALTKNANRVTKQYEKLVPPTTTEKDIMTSATPNPQQAAVDADTQQLTADITTLASVQSQIATLVSNAQAANTPLDTSALDALVQQAAPVVSNYQSLIPADPSTGN